MVKVKKGLIIIGIMVLVIGLLVPITYSYYHTRTNEITVKKTYIDNSGHNSHYMIVDTNGVLYEMDSVYVKGAWGIDREWQKLEENKTYKITYCGWRFPFLDMYPTVYKVKLIDTNSTFGEVHEL